MATYRPQRYTSPNPTVPACPPGLGPYCFLKPVPAVTLGVSHHGEQVRAALRQPHERAAVVHFQPAQANGTIEALRVFRRRALVAEQERAVEFLDVDPAILHWLEGVGVLHQAAGGFVRIGIGSVGDELHQARPRSCAFITPRCEL